MKHNFSDQPLNYDGSQLRPLFAYETFGLRGDSVVSFIGACDVEKQHMLDGEDKFAGDQIKGSEMLHFIIEVFRPNLFAAVSFQRLVASLCGETLMQMSDQPIRREGDDLFFGEGKLSISVASVSSVSFMVHFAVNISNKGTPVKTASLEDLKLSGKDVAESLLQKISQEFSEIEDATKKVFPL